MYTAGPSGVVTVPCLKPRFLVASDRSQVARRRVRLDLVTSGSLNSNSTRARTSLVPKPLPSCDAFASDWSIPRTPGSVSSSHHPSPLFPRATYDWAYPIGSPFQHCNVWSDGLFALKRLASTVPVRQQGRAFFSAPPLDDMSCDSPTPWCSTRQRRRQATRRAPRRWRAPCPTRATRSIKFTKPSNT